MNTLALLDYLVFGGYFVIIMSIAVYVSRKPKGHERNSEDYFLAGRSLPWWVIGMSLIASNISTEQIIGMNGTAFESGIAVISYSWIGASLSIIIVAKYFLPVFLKLKIYSLPEFLEKRYDNKVSTGMSVYWILVWVFVNLTSVMSLGAITLDAILGIPIIYSIIGLAVISAIYTIYGGLTAVAWTDPIQVVVLIIGGIAVVYLGLDAVSVGEGALNGFYQLMAEKPESFHTILPADHQELPWTGVFLGGLWIAALSYWGCNQYVIQRALAAKNLKEAQNGLMFAAFLSFVVSIIIVLPGVIAAYLYGDEISSRDQAFPYLVKQLLPAGFVGLVIASLIAAIISSLNSMCNSVATVFTMDIYKRNINRQASAARLILIGRITTAVALVAAALVAPSIASIGKLFAFIQEYTGFVSPGVFCVFIMGFAWKKANAKAALVVLLLTVPISMLCKFALSDMAFLNRMMVTFVVLVAVMTVVSKMTKTQENVVQIDSSYYEGNSPIGFIIGGIFMIGLISASYVAFA